MPRDSSEFTRLADGTLLLRQDDGTWRPVVSETDHSRLDRLSEQDIESIAVSDPDHPGLDDAFWVDADPPFATEAVSLQIDRDVLAYFREQGSAENRINAVLKHYVEARRKAG